MSPPVSNSHPTLLCTQECSLCSLDITQRKPLQSCGHTGGWKVEEDTSPFLPALSSVSTCFSTCFCLCANLSFLLFFLTLSLPTGHLASQCPGPNPCWTLPKDVSMWSTSPPLQWLCSSRNPPPLLLHLQEPNTPVLPAKGCLGPWKQLLPSPCHPETNLPPWMEPGDNPPTTVSSPSA